MYSDTDRANAAKLAASLASVKAELDLVKTQVTRTASYTSALVDWVCGPLNATGKSRDISKSIGGRVLALVNRK